MVKLVDTADLKSAAERRAGSIPARSTTPSFADVRGHPGSSRLHSGNPNQRSKIGAPNGLTVNQSSLFPIDRSRRYGFLPRADLIQAAILEPDAPGISYALFRVELLGTVPTERSVARAINAWHHGYDVPAFTRMAALAHAWLGEASDAYQAFNTLIRDGRNPENAAWATSWLARLEKGVPQDELLTAMRGENPAPHRFKSWTSDGR